MASERESASESIESDTALVTAILRRDRKATAEFVRLYADAVHGFVWKRLAPRVDATDDVVQEIFLAAWANLKTYSGSAPLRHWLLSIARHKVEDYYRRTLRDAATFAEEEMEPGDTGVETMEVHLDRERMQARAAELMGRLRYEYALLLRWRYWDKRPVREMAQETGKTEKAIERMLARAREEFRRLWEGDRDV